MLRLPICDPLALVEATEEALESNRGLRGKTPLGWGNGVWRAERPFEGSHAQGTAARTRRTSEVTAERPFEAAEEGREVGGC